MNGSVALVLSTDFGGNVVALAHQMPVWILSSPDNDRAVRVARPSFVEGHITTLLARPGEEQADLLARAIYAIDEHHGEASRLTPYKTLWVYGTTEKPSHEIASELGFKSITPTADGFRAEK